MQQALTRSSEHSPGPGHSSSSDSSSSSALAHASPRETNSGSAVATDLRSALPNPTEEVRMQPEAQPSSRTPRIVTRDLRASFGSTQAVRGVSMDFRDHQVKAIIGPSGCGKSTLLRCINRMHETVPTARVEGQVLLDGQDIYARDVNAIDVRRLIGMVFQRPTAFPTMSIRDNVAAGLRILPRAHALGRTELQEAVERALRR